MGCCHMNREKEALSTIFYDSQGAVNSFRKQVLRKPDITAGEEDSSVYCPSQNNMAQTKMGKDMSTF